jgi:hypothetical protein
VLLEILSTGATGPASKTADGGDLLALSLIKNDRGYPGDADHVRIQHAQAETSGHPSIDGISTPVEDAHGDNRGEVMTSRNGLLSAHDQRTMWSRVWVFHYAVPPLVGIRDSPN